MFLEITAGLFLNKHHDRLADILRMIQQDSVLFWKQKPNLDTQFQNHNVKTNSLGFRCHEIKPKNKTRIICMGASPTFGWGVRYEDTYPVLIGEELNKRNFNVESINAGEIGYSSWQGVNLFRKIIIDLKPDIITVSYVINDIDKYRFFRSSAESDSRLSALPQRVVFINNIIYQSKIFALMRNFAFNHRSKKSIYYGSVYGDSYNENRRVSLNEYENNLNTIADLAKANNIKVVFVVMPVNLPSKKMLTEEEKYEIKTFLSEAKQKIDSSDYPSAVKILNKILYIDKYSAVANYYLGIVSYKQKMYKQSDEFFENAKNFEIFDCASEALEYNETMRKVSKERQIPLCDCPKDFELYKSGYLFVDPEKDSFHPNAQGHKIIAGRLAQILSNFFTGE